MALVAARVDVERWTISGSAQQHGSVYLNARAAGMLASLDATGRWSIRSRHLSRTVSPIGWIRAPASSAAR